MNNGNMQRMENLMNEFENLKRSYIATVQIGIACKTGYNEAKNGNELLHKFCEMLVDSSNYSEKDKCYMKQELDCVKTMLEQEIKKHYEK